MDATACRFFKSPIGCLRGDSCTYRHDPPAPSVDDGIILSAANPYAESDFRRPCRFFFSGTGCRNGDDCPYTHAYSDPAVYYPHDKAVPPIPPPIPLTIDPPPPQKLRKKQYEVISEVLPVLTREIEGPFFAIDVECVATGTGHNDRDVARIAVVDENEEVFYDEYIKPDKPVVSYLTQLTGISESNLVNAPSLAEALVRLKAVLPKDSVIVGQSIKKDLEWLTLEKDRDFRQMFDVADLFRVPMQSNNGAIRYRCFSLRHVAKYLLGHDIQEADHDPVIDAKYAMKIFKQFRYLHESPGHRDAVYQTLLKTPRTPSFADRYPMIDGVLMRPPRKPNMSPSIRAMGAYTHGL